MKTHRWSASQRRMGLIAATVAVALAVALGGVIATRGGGHPTAATRGSQGSQPKIDSKSHVATSPVTVAPTSAQTTGTCQLTATSTAPGPEAVLPSNPMALTIQPSGGIWTMSVTNGNVYVVNGQGLYEYSLTGSLLHHFSLPSSITNYSDNVISQPVVAPDGNVFVSSYYGMTVVKVTPSGTTSSFDPGNANPINIFALHGSDGSWELGITTVGRDTSYVYDESGTQSGTVPLRLGENGYTNTGPDNEILYATGEGLVQTWDPTATKMLSEFGNDQGARSYTGSGYNFFYPGQAVYASGAIYTADGLNDLTVTQPNGLLVGSTSLNGKLADSVSVAGFMGASDSNLYVETGPPFDTGADTISVIPTSTVAEFMDAPGASTHNLGWGAGLSTGKTGEYFPPGSSVSVDATFDSWWASMASSLELTYRVWDESSILSGTAPGATTVRLPTTASSLAALPLTLSSSNKAIGPHEVQAWLYSMSGSKLTLVGSTCMPYTVGASGDNLDFSTLPAGTGAGGAADNRAVALNAQLGLTGLRGASIDWSSVLPNCNAGSPSASTCGASAIRTSALSKTPFNAAYLSRQDGVRYWIQLSTGDSVSMALVNAGLWQQDVQKIVSFYNTVPSGCTNCLRVTAWEPWNESNNTGWPNAATYVSQVLKPFYQAVKAVNAGDTVVGGTSLGVDISWWRTLISAGGLSYMTVASVHPYPGSNDSWEEDGMENQLSQLEKMIGSKPLWLTEVGWWSDGQYNFLHQADAITRALIWQRLLKIPVWNYFIDEGDFSNPTDPTYSLIQADDYNSSDDYVKPSALGAMTEAHMLAGRTVLGQSATGIPQAYAANFGAVGGGDHDVTALWTDGLSTTGGMTISGAKGASVPVTMTTEYGATTNLTLKAGMTYNVALSDQVVYMTFPTGHTLSISPTEAYGTDLALASSGASATASSGSNAAAVLSNPADVTYEGIGWESSSHDVDPTLTVKMKAASKINRVLVDTQSVGSTAPGLRNYTISIETPSGTWQTVASVTDEFRYHVEQLAFTPVVAQAVRVTVTSVDYGGYANGSLPSFRSTLSCPSQAFIHSIEIYDGTSSPSTVNGRSLPTLP